MLLSNLEGHITSKAPTRESSLALCLGLYQFSSPCEPDTRGRGETCTHVCMHASLFRQMQWHQLLPCYWRLKCFAPKCFPPLSARANNTVLNHFFKVWFFQGCLTRRQFCCLLSGWSRTMTMKSLSKPRITLTGLFSSVTHCCLERLEGNFQASLKLEESLW